MNIALQIILLVIIFSTSVSLMLGKNIGSSKRFRISWGVALIDLLVILVFFELKQSILLYITFTTVIVIFTLGLRNLVNNYNKNSLSPNDFRQRFANFFAYFLLFFLMMLTVGVLKNIVYDSPL